MTDEEESQHYEKLSTVADALSISLEWLPGDFNHRESVAVVLTAVWRYIERNRDCCMPEGPAAFISECMLFVNALELATFEAKRSCN